MGTMVVMPYQRLTCYFLSGTGNSFRAACWLAQAAEARGIASEVIPIDHASPREELQAGAGQLVGLYHPAHGLMPPWSMLKFLFRLPAGSRSGPTVARPACAAPASANSTRSSRATFGCS